ncbi:PDZ domain-containing protein [Tenuibacillus multivorans]|uniref:PDZ domain-containing protein n=1 Tax=Tenuibacillus multivorans TaxID=237069 RepID=A0A1H0DJU3_9BACI|nr:PDZ domain-containing protein [Tenuibacillus multivorans]GEL76521.1 membrane protein [Tenuibacillus multivorans]SDN70440.1 hypothetical protein SAMN05216498_2904 [Tenuibacillus multivorans]
MGVEWLKEFGIATLWIFAQPIIYVAIAFTFWTGYKRIKHDRHAFGHRVFPIGSEWKGTWLSGIMVGVLISALLILSGSMVNYEWLLLLSVVMLVFALFNQVWLFSPVYTIGLVAVVIWGLTTFEVELLPWLSPITNVDPVFISYLLVVFIFAEILIMATTKRRHTFPDMKKGDRGKFVGSHVVKRMMFVPFFIPVTGGALELTVFEWWPVFGIGDSFGLMLFPFVIGYAQRFQGDFADVGTKKAAKAVSILAVLLVGGAVGVYFMNELAIVLVAVAMIGRALIHWVGRSFDSEKRPIFTPQPYGIIVVGVIPGSPADDMGIQIGEKIERIHDIDVTNEHEFFEVMSENRTFCKLTIRGLDGEVRFAQRALYQGEYHELGLIFVKETPRFTLKTEEIN